MQSLEWTKTRYRQLFAAARQTLAQQIYGLWDEVLLTRPAEWPTAGSPEVEAIEAALFEADQWPGLRPWREAALQWVETQVGPQLVASIRQFQQERDGVKCHHNGACCRLGSSPYSWQQLCDRAAQGDTFAQQFTQVFLPYPSPEAARQRFPEAVAELLQFATDRRANGDTTQVYFYHCPYIQADNRCGLYGTDKRPAICSSYPETPLVYVERHCAWRPWHDRWEEATLLTHASVALCEFYQQQLQQALQQQQA